MKSVQLSELRERLDEFIEAVRNGETVELLEGECSVAKAKPLPQPTPARNNNSDEEWIEKLVARGVIRKGPTWGQPLPEEFFTRPRPVPKASVLEQLLEDRHSGD